MNSLNVNNLELPNKKTHQKLGELEVKALCKNGENLKTLVTF